MVLGLSAATPDESFESAISADIQAQVQHHAPCVPECPVCYPESE